MEAALADESLQQAAQVNPVDKFALVFTNLLDTLFVERMDQKGVVAILSGKEVERS